MTVRTLVFSALGWLFFLGGIAAAGDTVPDFTHPDLKQLRIEFVKPKKEKTGFIIGGKNPTALIRTLQSINGRTIAELEKDMRPGAESKVGTRKGFLGEGESLLAVLEMDNRYVVDELGLTHQELARHLHILGAIANQEEKGEKTFTYHGRRFHVKVVRFRGVAHSPFYDGTKTNVNATITNLDTGKKLTLSLLVPHLIERYGFYEGRGTPYRVEPRDVLAVLDFLKSKKGAKKSGD